MSNLIYTDKTPAVTEPPVTEPAVAEPADTGAAQQTAEQVKYAKKYSSVEELEKAYSHATTKINNQAVELKTFKEKYKAPEKYDVDKWVEEGVLPKQFNVRDPEVAIALNAFKEAGVNNEQAQAILKNYTTKVLENVPSQEEFLKREVAKFGSEQEYKAVSARIVEFADKLPEDKREVFKNMCGSSAEAMQLMDMLVNPKDSTIPKYASTAVAQTHEEVLAEIIEFNAKHRDRLHTSPELQNEQLRLYGKLDKAKKQI